ncbi:MAG: serine kinase [Cyanobacteria bacterium P01_A01_bin.40]
MFEYNSYGLRISSELLLPELIESNNSAKTDITILRGSLEPPKLEPTLTNCYCKLTEDEAYLAWEQVGTFLVRGGREIIVDLIPNVEESIVRLFLLGAGLGMLLHQRGLFLLHASTVKIGDRAVSFMGDKGWGKSTTAGALHRRGHQLMTDDVTAIDLSNPQCPMILPGYGQLKLWPESAIALGNNPETLPLLHPQLEKRDRLIKQDLALNPVPLKQIYLLGGGEKLAIENLSAQQALGAVMHNWYCARFGSQMMQAIDMSEHFHRCTSLINQIQMSCLKREKSLDALDKIAQLVESHLDPTQPLAM